MQTLGTIGDTHVIDILLVRLQDTGENQEVRQAAAISLGRIGDARCIEALFACLHDLDEFLRHAALGGLAWTCEDRIDRDLLSQDLDGLGLWLDPQSPITAERITEASEQLDKPPEEIRQRYTALAERFGLRLA